jgi:hypothetical protein
MGLSASGVIRSCIPWGRGPETMVSGENLVSGILPKKSSKIIASSIQWDTGPTASEEILARIQWDTRPEAMGSGAEIVVSVIRSKKSS